MVSSYVTHWYRVLSRISAELISRRSPSQAFFSPLLVLLYTSTQDPTCALSSFNHHECCTEFQGDGSLQVQPHVRTVTFLQLSVNSSLENTPETLTCGQRRCAHGQFVFLDGRVSYAARAVCDQLLPELLLALARLVCCPRDTAGSPHGLRYVFFYLLLPLLPLPESTLYDAQERRPHEPPLSVIGKAEGASSERHGHVTALSVAPEYRRLGLSRKFMTWLEKVSDENYRGFFVDLYVRCVNYAAISMYEGFGYSVYRRVKEYYTNLGLGLNPRDEEDGFGACPFVSQLCPCRCRRC